MPFWSGELLARQIPHAGIIKPYDSEHIDCNSYILGMGREAYVTPNYEASLSTRTIKILNDHDHFIIPAGQFAFLLTEEIISLPDNVMGFISLRTSIKFQGLINVSGFHVDPGFCGHLVYAVYNAGPSDINLRRGMRIFKIWLASLDVDKSAYAMNSNGKIGNQHINPNLINGVPGEIFSMQGFSKRLTTIETELVFIKKIVTAAGIILGLLFAAMQINWRGF